MERQRNDGVRTHGDGSEKKSSAKQKEDGEETSLMTNAVRHGHKNNKNKNNNIIYLKKKYIYIIFQPGFNKVHLSIILILLLLTIKCFVSLICHRNHPDQFRSVKQEVHRDSRSVWLDGETHRCRCDFTAAPHSHWRDNMSYNEKDISPGFHFTFIYFF